MKIWSVLIFWYSICLYVSCVLWVEREVKMVQLVFRVPVFFYTPTLLEMFHKFKSKSRSRKNVLLLEHSGSNSSVLSLFDLKLDFGRRGVLFLNFFYLLFLYQSSLLEMRKKPRWMDQIKRIGKEKGNCYRSYWQHKTPSSPQSVHIL